MRWKDTLQALVIIVAALALALGTNAFASRQRKLSLPGYYPNALRVPPRAPEEAAAPAPVAPAAVTTAEPAVATPLVAAAPAATTTTTAAPSRAAVGTAGPGPAPAAPVATKAPAGATATTAPAPAAAETLEKFQPHPDKAYVEIGGDDVALLHRHGALFLDARRTSVYEDGHIAGARPFSVWESDIDAKVAALFNERADPREQNRPIVIYCSGGACEDSHMLAEKLWGVQFNNVYVYKDGFPDWQKRGGAIRMGGQP